MKPQKINYNRPSLWLAFYSKRNYKRDIRIRIFWPNGKSQYSCDGFYQESPDSYDYIPCWWHHGIKSHKQAIAAARKYDLGQTSPMIFLGNL